MNSLTNYVEDGALGSGGFADVVRAVNIVGSKAAFGTRSVRLTR